MTAPPVAPPTVRVYDALPEHYRDADARLDYPLLRYLSLIGDQLDAVDELIDRIGYDADDDAAYRDGTYGAGVYGSDTYGNDGVPVVAGTSALVDPATANAAWLPWLAQLYGIRITGLDVPAARALLANPAAAWDHGTPGAIAEASARGLTGTRAVTVTAHYGGDPYVIGLGTKDSETATPDTFAELAAVAPRWADLGTWAKAAAPSVLAAAEVERPAGYRMVRYSTGA